MNSLGVIITIIFVVIWVVRGIASVMGNDAQQQAGNATKAQPGDLDRRIAAQRARRARLAEQQRNQAQISRQNMPQKDLSQMSMAERIELARQRARSGPAAQEQRIEEARMQQAREVQQREAARQQAQEQAQRQRAEQARQQRAAARKQAEQDQARQEQLERRRRRAQRQARQARQQRKAAQASPAQQQAAASRKQQRQARKPVSTKGNERGHGLGDMGQTVSPDKRKDAGKVSIGPLDQQSLRRAFIMKELLDKPVALRGEQDGLLS